jgi:excisionase family DNA binding protein
MNTLTEICNTRLDAVVLGVFPRGNERHEQLRKSVKGLIEDQVRRQLRLRCGSTWICSTGWLRVDAIGMDAFSLSCEKLLMALLKLKQVAERLNCSLSNVYSLAATGELPIHRVGVKKGLRVAEDDLLAYLRKVRSEGMEIEDENLKHIH